MTTQPNAARTNMLKQQLRVNDILDDALLALIENTPRESFVPEAYKGLAFTDTMIPLAHEQLMMTPLDEARMIKALQLKPTDHVLEIGTGSGYTTALFAQLAQHVTTVDIFEDFTHGAKNRLTQLGLSNVDYLTQDASLGFETQEPFDVIAITGSLPDLPGQFKTILDASGRLFAILGASPVMQATLLQRESGDKWSYDCLFETNMTPLIGAKTKQPFTF